jgi:recombinational DNA repair protein (RecF pathway)
MYSKTHTKAIVVGYHDVGEASRLYRLFTRDLGMVFARCQSSRTTASKHRYSLQLLSVCDVSLIRSKSGWRLTNAVPLTSLFTVHEKNPHARALVTRVLALVRRMVVGEEQGIELFDLVWNGLAFLETGNVSQENMKWFEALFVLRILNVLGYVQKDDAYTPHLSSSSEFSLELIESFAPAHKTAITEINRALEASHL